MTAEQLLIIDVIDLALAEIRCLECKAFLALPIDKQLNEKLVCPNCNRVLLRADTDSGLAIFNLLRDLAAWSSAKDKSCRVTFAIKT